MNILDKILTTPENQMRDADHMDRKDITQAEFREALTELCNKYKDSKSLNPISEADRKTRSSEILKALNSEKNDCNKEHYNRFIWKRKAAYGYD